MAVTKNPAAAGTETGAFFRRLDWSAFWTATALVLGLYSYTLAPTVTLEDSGELAVASNFLGVPHPPGYPIWSMLTWVFARIFSFVTFRGQPNPAWAVAFFSAVCGAFAAGVTAMLICRSGSDLLRETRDKIHRTSGRAEDLICWTGGVVCSLAFAFTPVEWSQSVIVEIYSLNALFLTLIFLLSYRWVCRPADKVLYLTAFVFGLGLTNYQVLLLAALPLVVLVMLKDTELFRDFLIVGAPFVAVILLVKTGVLTGIVHPLHSSCFIYLFLNFAALALAFFFLPRGKTVALTILLAELGVAFYAYMPIVSDLRNPPINWGYPRTWEGFNHALSRGQYERIVPTDVFSMTFVHQIGDYLTDLRVQFTLAIALLGFLPFSVWQMTGLRRRINALYIAVILAAVSAVIILAERVLFPQGWPLAIVIYKLLIVVIMAITVLGGTAIFVSQSEEFLLKLRGRTPSTVSERFAIGLAILGVGAVLLLYIVKLAGNLVAVTAPLRQGGQPVPSDQIGRIFLQSGGILALMVAPFALFILVAWLMRSRHQFRMAIEHTSQKWVIATLMGFMVMSLVLIALANPKGDIQDAFIQRVKFISSHALFAFWIGYGLIFGLAFVDTVFGRYPLVRRLSLVAALALPLVPIHENYRNKDLIRVSGGAQQNGHDFGWQFGNYQLRGADAISEELSPDEEPLPNPSFPPTMGTNAIFFGGTDPGRFVPTYMIYDAAVREDCYLITQNALADNTYMSVMRDLYGDRIWIPAAPDSARAFQRYVDEVKTGKRPRNAELTIENGRVQVSGALGVMEINGILAQMIFEHNNYRHDFYVEESYVIAWMYPYLEPHGLIMKINRNPLGLSPEVARNDLDFWDWYTRRLVNDDKFRVDVVARKSFSKLRSSIGGLYANRGMYREGETAFQEARALYPLSPEANFRLVQEVLLREGRFSEAKAIMQEFWEQDPGNTKAREFVGEIERIEDMSQQISSMESELSKGRLEVDEALKLAELYRQSGQMPKFMNLTANIGGNSNLPPIYQFQVAQLYLKAGRIQEMGKILDQCVTRLPGDAPPEVYLDIATMYANANQPAKVKTALEQYLARRPNDWKAWLDLASLQISSREEAGVRRSLDQAIRYGGQEAVDTIQRDPRFAPFREQATPRIRDLMGLP